MAQALAVSLTASADYLGNGAIEINKYETEILDIVRRTSSTVQRMKDRGAFRPATGHPHRYFEQTGIAVAGATDPRNIAPTPSGPTRVERPAMIKGLTAQSNFSHFDVEVTAQQSQFQVEAKDINDLVNAIVLLEAQMFWQGTDTSLTAPTTLQWVGALQQIASGGNVGTVLKGASIIDAIKTEVATMMGNTTFGPRPTAIFANPLLLDLIDQEAKAAAYKFNVSEFVAGEQVNAIQTQAGVLPLIPDVFMPNWTSANSSTISNLGLTSIPAGSTTSYQIVILQEDLIEIPFVNPNGSSDPRIFQLGLLSGLQGQMVAIAYNSLILKGASYGHALLQCFR